MESCELIEWMKRHGGELATMITVWDNTAGIIAAAVDTLDNDPPYVMALFGEQDGEQITETESISETDPMKMATFLEKEIGDWVAQG